MALFQKEYSTQKSLKVDFSQTVTINLGLVILIFGVAGPSSITIHTNTQGLPNCNSAAYISPVQMARHCSLLKRLSHSRFIGSCVLRGLSIDVSADIAVNC